MGLTKWEISTGIICAAVIVGMFFFPAKRKENHDAPKSSLASKWMSVPETKEIVRRRLTGTTDKTGRYEISDVSLESSGTGLIVTLTIIPTLATAPEDTPPPVGDWPDLTDWDRVPIP